MDIPSINAAICSAPTTDTPAPAMRVVAIGDNCLDWYLDRQMVHPGGNALNVAVYCHRLGTESSYIGQFGTDWAGDLMVRARENEGIDISRIRRKDGTSGYATIENILGDRVFRGSSDGVVAFQPDSDDVASMAGADVIHTGDSSFLEKYVPEFASPKVKPAHTPWLTASSTMSRPPARPGSWTPWEPVTLSLQPCSAPGSAADPLPRLPPKPARSRPPHARPWEHSATGSQPRA